MDLTPMRILVVGQGSRETAMCRALTSATPLPELLIAPGNAGTGAFGQNVPVDAGDVDALVRLATREGVDLVVPGPELPLVRGLADQLAERRIPCCGPTKACAALEGSKIFARTLAQEVGVPSPHFAVTRRVAELAWAIDAWDGVPVLKADGLASGKGVFLPSTKAECQSIGERLLAGELGPAGREIVLEERLAGVEASLFFACDAALAVPLPHAKDYKRLADGDAGPNTGGMGATSPNPQVDEALSALVQRDFVEPVLAELVRRGTPYHGFLYAGIMLTRDGPRLLEFNVRLGDPEAQVILPRLPAGAFVELCSAVAQGKLAAVAAPRAAAHYAVGVVMAAGGYPGEPKTGDEIAIDADLEEGTIWIDWGGAQYRDAHLFTSGGRVGTVVGTGVTPEVARRNAYDALERVRFSGAQYRRDIGAQA